MRNVRLHARQYHLCYAFSTKSWISDTEAVIISGKSGSPELADAKRQRHLPLGGSCGAIAETGQNLEMRL
ncbi:hypothetical protein E2C01_076987 [Portunus trituberculatus]|uniref:Uncharacterized protein n=1 Tax=Portunus trituberculatus TaxID=210409 RepID=A0A5B7IND4_PORTR|nr:hypothetical protein [Portunus trituberculatus]